MLLMSLDQNLFELGDIVVERGTSGKRKRIGEIIFIKEGKRTKLKLIELKRCQHCCFPTALACQ